MLFPLRKFQQEKESNTQSCCYSYCFLCKFCVKIRNHKATEYLKCFVEQNIFVLLGKKSLRKIQIVCSNGGRSRCSGLAFQLLLYCKSFLRKLENIQLAFVCLKLAALQNENVTILRQCFDRYLCFCFICTEHVLLSHAELTALSDNIYRSYSTRYFELD